MVNVFAPEEIGARIAQARVEAGLRQEDLADLIGVGTRTVQNYEAGSTAPYRKLRAIAEVTGVSLERLLHGDDREHAAPDDAQFMALMRRTVLEVLEEWQKPRLEAQLAVLGRLEKALLDSQGRRRAG